MNHIQILETNFARLPERDRDFASSILAAAKSAKGASEKQLYWITKLAERAAGTEPTPTTEKVGDLAGVMTLFATARQKLKHPAIVLGYGDRELRLSVATERARVPGSINVVDEESRTWFGRIHQDGRFEHSSRETVPAVVTTTLQRFACDPAKVAAEHGRLTGKCCFCNTALTDERSTSVGYGPVCAKNYGLAWGKAS